MVHNNKFCVIIPIIQNIDESFIIFILPFTDCYFAVSMGSHHTTVLSQIFVT